MTTTTDKQAIEDALAASWAELDPNHTSLCLSCRELFLVRRPDGSASMTCPKCGAGPGIDCAKALATHVQYRKDVEAKALQDEIDAATAAAPQSKPPLLDDVIGNAPAVLQIRTALDGFRFVLNQPSAPKWLPFPHTVISSPGGLGKSMLASIIARELKRKLHLQMGQTLKTPAKVAEALLALRPGDILFIEECHDMPNTAQEALYLAMEDGILIPVTKAGTALAKPVKVAPFTLIGATTDAFRLLPSMRQRFQHHVQLSRLSPEELSKAMAQRAERSGWSVVPWAIEMIGERALGTPRLAITLLNECMTTANASGGREIDPETVRRTCEVWQIDSLGLDRVARQYLQILGDSGGGPVRLNVIASKLDGLNRITIERNIEPNLVYLGLIDKQANGRVLTQAGREHLQKESQCE